MGCYPKQFSYARHGWAKLALNRRAPRRAELVAGSGAGDSVQVPSEAVLNQCPGTVLRSIFKMRHNIEVPECMWPSDSPMAF